MDKNGFSNEFSWSNSRHNLFQKCKRKYFYQYYSSWNGWDNKSDKEAQVLYKLKKLDNRYTWKGNLILDAIAFLLNARLRNQEIDHNLFQKVLVKRMRNQFRESKNREYDPDPKNKFGLLEHEYEKEINDDVWRALREDVFKDLENFKNSEFWEVADTIDFDDCLALEGDLDNSENLWKSKSTEVESFLKLPYMPAVDNFQVDGIKVWVKLDFAYLKPNGSVHIIDWKTGKSDEKPDPMQLNLYGYFASEIWDIPENEIELTIYNVSQDERFDRNFNNNLKTEVESSIKKSSKKMKDFLVNPKQNKADEDDFPKIDNENICRRCRYRKICKPELVE